jgi:hypothetical protein
LERRDAYRIRVRRPEGLIPMRISSRRLVNKIKMILREQWGDKV